MIRRKIRGEASRRSLQKNEDRRISWWGWLWRVAAVLIALIFAVWICPEWLNRRNFANARDRAAAVNAARVPVAGLFLAAAGGLTAWSNHRGVNETKRANEITSLVTRQGQRSDRFTKALELTNSPILSSRIGGLVTLEQLALEDPAAYYASVMRVVCAFIRESAPWPPRTPGTVHAGDNQQEVEATTIDLMKEKYRLASDVHEALMVIARRDAVHARAVELKIKLEDVVLDLRHTDLRGAELGKINLDHALLTKTHFENSRLIGTSLVGANLIRANFKFAFLVNIDLSEAKLQHADLSDTMVANIIFSKANLEGTDLRDSSGLQQNQIDDAIGDGLTKVSSDLKRPSDWPTEGGITI